jgi:hypothetical protein
MGPANANAGPFRRGDGYARRAPAGAYSAYSRRMPAGVEESTPAARCSSSRTSVARLAVVARHASRFHVPEALIFLRFFTRPNAHWRREFSRVAIFSNSLDADRRLPTRTRPLRVRGHLAALRGRRQVPAFLPRASLRSFFRPRRTPGGASASVSLPRRSLRRVFPPSRWEVAFPSRALIDAEASGRTRLEVARRPGEPP